MQFHKAICPTFLFWFTFLIGNSFLSPSQGSLGLNASPTSLDGCQSSIFEPNKDGFYVYRLKHYAIDPFIDKLKAIVNDPGIPSQYKNDLERAIDFCVPDLESRSIIFCASPKILDKLNKLALAIDTPAREPNLEILIVKTPIANSSAFIVNEVSLDRFNSLDISVGKSITYQDFCCHSMSELRFHIFNDPQIDIISATHTSKQDANTIVNRKTLYTLTQDVLAYLYGNTKLNDVQIFEVGMTVQIKTQMCDDLGVGLSIFSENITSNLNIRGCLDNDSIADITSSLLSVNQVTKDVNVPHGSFAVIPLLTEDNEKQESVILIVRLAPLIIEEQFQVMDIFK